MKTYIFLILTLLFQSLWAQFDDQISGKQAIDAAYDISNAAVRITKDYVYSNMHVSYATKNIDNSFSNSEDALLLLQMYAENHPALQPNLKQIINIRKKTRMMFLQKPQKEKIKTALQKLEKLQIVNNSLINKIKKIENIKIKQAVESAHKLEFLAQQLAFMHALIYMGQNPEKMEEKIKDLEKKFETNLKTLADGAHTNKEAGFQLKLLQSDWEMYKKIAAKKNQRFINTIYTLLDKISDKASRIASSL